MKTIMGARFGRLIAIRRVRDYRCNNGQMVPRWEYQCDCGKKTKKVAQYVMRGGTQSCGCLQRETGIQNGKNNRLHGEARKTREYLCWSNMRRRCYYQLATGYENYGGRGIRVCRRWRYSYKNFLADMGRSPGKGWSIERINNEGHYTPRNCKWATRHEQNINTRKQKPKKEG